ncbi:hypothetical protein SFRURICE_015365 [Spodoptera frugiperda]|nr:hypothetical protein SFRURICE_015365 [Spodoptera frugiperda]
MEGQINVLKDLQSVMTKALTNYKKSPKDRLTVEYIETRLELLENDWSSFKDTKCSLYKNYKLEDISQKVADIYDTTEDTYITYKCAMKSALNKLKAKECIVQQESRFRALEFIEPNKVHQSSNITHAHSSRAMLATKTSSMLCDFSMSIVLLATALIKAESKTGQFMTVRALLDQGSQACFITEATVQLLRLKKSLGSGVITGLGNNSSTAAKYMVTLTIKSQTDDSFQLKINAYVLEHLRPVKEGDDKKDQAVYLPHHAVVRDGEKWNSNNQEIMKIIDQMKEVEQPGPIRKENKDLEIKLDSTIKNFKFNP